MSATIITVFGRRCTIDDDLNWKCENDPDSERTFNESLDLIDRPGFDPNPPATVAFEIVRMYGGKVERFDEPEYDEIPLPGKGV